MPLHMYQKLFHTITNEHLAATKDDSIQLKTFKKTLITQLGTCRIKIEHNSKHKMCKVFVVPGNGQDLLCMPDFDHLIS